MGCDAGELARHGQMVALDPLWPDRATVGGIVATNDSGALRLKFGGLRDLIIGMTIVLADGTIAKTGGKVVKNVAGYDLHKLMTGSFGTLGVIAEVNFRLHPVEEHARTWTVVAPMSASRTPHSLKRPSRADGFADALPRACSSACRNRNARSTSASLPLPECLDEHASAHCRASSDELRVTEASEAVWQARQRLFDENDARCSEGVAASQRNLCRQLGAAAMVRPRKDWRLTSWRRRPA